MTNIVAHCDISVRKEIGERHNYDWESVDWSMVVEATEDAPYCTISDTAMGHGAQRAG